jgi:preprotein translocase subunit SecG
MYYALLFAHLTIAILIVVVVLLQRSEGSSLQASDLQSFGTRRAAAHPLTRLTGILAFLFVVTSISLTLVQQRSHKPSSILDSVPVESKAPAVAPDATLPPKPEAEKAPDPTKPPVPTVPVQK